MLSPHRKVPPEAASVRPASLGPRAPDSQDLPPALQKLTV